MGAELLRGAAELLREGAELLRGAAVLLRGAAVLLCEVDLLPLNAPLLLPLLREGVLLALGVREGVPAYLLPLAGREGPALLLLREGAFG